ncbi:unnamed protein product [Cuscuta epithymum]|uniref:DCD domain-containing protein n=1 Tax=Cuscuta epithymum TaxID=186058 RepID=A0AAV0FF91_9ASTE|nr:unnamed protein product [Cuscuta epithymum]
MFERCYALMEEQFYPIIADNYYDQSRHFWFEMDHSQTAKMISLFSSSAQPYARPYHHHRPTIEASCSIPRNRYTAPLPYDGGKLQSASTSEVIPQKDAHPSSEQKSWSSLFKKHTSSGPSSPLAEDYNGGEWESCSSPPINKSELHEACREDIEEEKTSSYPLIEAPGVYSGEWEGQEDNAEGFEEPFVEAPEDMLSMLMQEVQLLKERQIEQEERIQALEKELASKRASKSRFL